jgi:hypothetical protein
VGIAGAIVFFKSDAGNIPALLTKLAEIVADSRRTLPIKDELVRQGPSIEMPGP